MSQLVSATGASGRIPDGTEIEVNDDTGVVTVLEPERRPVGDRAW